MSIVRIGVNKLLVFIFIAALFVCSGCSGGAAGGGATGTDGFFAGEPSAVAPLPANPSLPASTESSGWGSLTIKVAVPSEESSDAENRVIPYRSRSLQVDITGDGIPPELSASIPDIAITRSLTINNIPSGLHEATLRILDQDGAVMAERKHGFYLLAGATMDAGTLAMGVALIPDDNGGYSVSPAAIDIPRGTTLCFENRDPANRHPVNLKDDYSSATRSCSLIDAAVPESEPHTPAHYFTGTIQFTSAGLYRYVSSDYSGGSASRILIYNPPALTKITPESDHHPSSNVSFTLKGSNFGTSQAMVDGQVQFINKETGQPAPNITITAWGDRQITGVVNVPRGEYRVRVAVRGTQTTGDVTFTEEN
jgi:hypothetical protein